MGYGCTLAQLRAEEPKQQAAPSVKDAWRWPVKQKPDDLPYSCARSCCQREAVEAERLGHLFHQSVRTQSGCGPCPSTQR